MKKLTACASFAVAAGLASLAPNVLASGFALGTQSASGVGNANAGGAAAAEDASVVWSNPAAMMALKSSRDLTIAVHALRPSFKFNDTGSTGPLFPPGTGNGGDGGDWNYVPSMYFVTALSPNVRIGVAINAPYGLKTQYDPGWRGQFTALTSKIMSLNVNPAVAVKLTDSLSVGAGLDFQWIQAKLSSFSGVGALGNATLDADDVAVGYNLGVLFQPLPSTRFGAAYRSVMHYNLQGNARFDGAVGGLFNGNISAILETPDMASVSAFQTLARQWEVMADVTWTGWHNVQNLTVVRTTPSAGGITGSTLTNLPFLWRNTWRYSVGANYIVNNRAKIRTGVALDQTPTTDQTRTPRLPDQNRKWVAAGLQYRVSQAGTVDVAYAHEFIKDANINLWAGPPTSNLLGTFSNKADIFSLQYSHKF